MTILKDIFHKAPRYFPPISPEARRLEVPIRRLAPSLPETEMAEFYQTLSHAHPDYTPCEFDVQEAHVAISQDKDRFVSPRSMPLVKYFLVTSG